MPKGIPNKKYTPEFKIMVVETMHKEGLSHREAGRFFEITAHDAVAKWERIYLEEAKSEMGNRCDRVFAFRQEALSFADY